MQRKVKFKVCATKQHTDLEWELFDAGEDYKMCEQFALDYQGDHKEIYIKKVFVLEERDRKGSEL